MHRRHAPSSRTDAKEYGVGLISVAQLTLSAEISETGTITEVYNLAVAGNADDHFPIPGNK